MWPFNPAYPALKPVDIGSQTVLPSHVTEGPAVYDYIVIGGGTAGAVVASRLSEDPSIRVLLLERGFVNDAWAARVPLMSAAHMSPGAPVYRTPAVAMDNLDGRTLTMVRGKALGGTSRINGMVYTRSFASEFNRWSESGRAGWSYDEIEPFFIKSEGLPNAPDHHGSGGPWKTHVFDRFFLTSTTKCVDAVESLGIPVVEDINTPESPAVTLGKLQATIDSDAYRCSTFEAFLPLKLALDRRSRLKICTGTVASSLHIEKGRVLGVMFFEELELEPEPGRQFYARACKEVVVCGGAIGSPQLLMLSGIGPASHLREFGIPVVKDLPGVGSNLQDHLGVSTMYRIPLRDSFHDLCDRPVRAAKEFLKYLLWGGGLFLCPITQISLFLRSDLFGDDLAFHADDPTRLDSTLPANIPDIEIMPIAFNTTDTEVPVGTGIFSFLAVVLQPASHGTVRLESTDPLQAPKCDLAFLTDPADRDVMRKAVQISQRIAERMREQGYPMVDQNVPESNDEKDLDTFINKNYRTTFHYSSTCRMAPEDDPSPGVVDDRLRVHGVQNLRIADCSILPNILANHLQAPAVMIGEKCAHMILEDAAAGHK
ncbi:alcohol oxidase [Mycena filopes]|nr:alcohol oxidase [Mycena filopes]